jgi:hypothetical protein
MSPRLRAASALAILTSCAAPAAAQQPPRGPVINALASHCAQVAQAAPRLGVALLKTGRGSGPWDYERVVRDASLCFPRQNTYPLWVETRDVAQCYVGFVCEDNRRGWRD